MTTEAKCNCQHCSGHIAFPAEMAGQMIECPHCHLETRLFTPLPALTKLPAPAFSNKHIKVVIAAAVIFVCMIMVGTYGCKAWNKYQREQQLALEKAEARWAKTANSASGIVSKNTNRPAGETSKMNAGKTPNCDIRLYRDDGIIVSNMGKDTWDTITIYVNSNPPFGYRCTIGPVKHLDSKVIPLREFTKKNGERFNPFANKVVKVWIGGGGYDYQSYGF